MNEPVDDASVRTLLDVAGVSPAPEEIAGLAAVYPLYLRSMQALYELPELRDEAPGTVFDPDPRFDTWGNDSERE